MKINKLIEELKKLAERHGDKKVTFVWHHEQTGSTEYYHIIEDQDFSDGRGAQISAEHMQFTDDIEIYVEDE